MTLSYGFSNLTLPAEPMVASGRFNADTELHFPVAPPEAWFAKQYFDAPLSVRVSAEGHIYGHVCGWKAEHIAPQFAGRTPPRSKSNYSYFHVNQVITAEGTEIETGVLTADTHHANVDDPEAALESILYSYDDTRHGVADVRVYEDQWGIQIAGALRPDVTPAQARMIRGSDISPDWRPVGKQGRFNNPLEMVALMCCNLSGFITNPLVASGSALPSNSVPAGQTAVVEDDEGNVIFMCGTAWAVADDRKYAVSEDGSEVPIEILQELETLRSRVESLEVLELRRRVGGLLADEPESDLTD